jgi:hypothetical protein
MLRRHWKLIPGFFFGVFLPVWQFLKWAVDWAGRYETVSSSLQKAGEMLDYILTPPPPLTLALMVIGLGLIAWDYRGRLWRLSIEGRAPPASSEPTAAGIPSQAELPLLPPAAETQPITQAWPNVIEWVTPSEALEKFTPRSLRRQLEGALEHCEETQRQMELLHKQTRDGRNKTIQIIMNETREKLASLQTKFNDGQVQVVLLRNQLIDNLVQQLQSGGLAAKGVKIENEKTHEEWEIIKSAYWVSLKFVTYDAKLTKVTGGGRTFHGVQIGRHRE